MQLLDAAGVAEQYGLQVDFPFQVDEVVPYALRIAGDDLVAGAVVTK